MQLMLTHCSSEVSGLFLCQSPNPANMQLELVRDSAPICSRMLQVQLQVANLDCWEFLSSPKHIHVYFTTKVKIHWIWIFSMVHKSLLTFSASALLMPIGWESDMVSNVCQIFCRYRQILEKAVNFTDADQLESLKAFVEASMLCLCFFSVIIHHYCLHVVAFRWKQFVLMQCFCVIFCSGQWKRQSCHLETAAHWLLHAPTQPARRHS